MIISNLGLVNFRNYERAGLELGQRTVILGKNGSGKTNILEAIYMLATGKSFRADSDRELVKYEQKLSVVSCQLSINSEIINLRLSIADRKRFEVNGVARRMTDFAGKLKAVLFGPEDIEIVTGSPGKRRKYLDFVLSQKDWEYRRSLVSYEKGLRQRNRLLDLIRDGRANRTQLFFWDKLLIKEGNYLTEKRERYLQDFDEHEIFYDKSVISETRLKMYEKEEILAGNTLVGPHRDDFAVLKKGKEISKYGSRGQQRMAVLALKIFELKQLSSDQLPVLLLDDVFSELDHEHRDEVLKIAGKHSENGGQVIMTTADRHLVPDGDWKIIELE